MEQAVRDNQRRSPTQSYALVHTHGEPGAFLVTVALRDASGRPLHAVSRVVPARTSTEAAVHGAALAHAVAYELGARKLDVFLDDAQACEILAGAVPAPEEMSKAYFHARTSARKLGTVRARRMPAELARDLNRPMPTPSRQELRKPRTLSLFGGEDAA